MFSLGYRPHHSGGDFVFAALLASTPRSILPLPEHLLQALSPTTPSIVGSRAYPVRTSFTF